MQVPIPSSSAPPATFNALLGIGLVLANGLLFYWYFFFYEVSENDMLWLTPTLVSFVAGQWGLLALTSGAPWRRLFWVAFGLSAAGAGLLWAGYFWLVAFSRGFNH